MGISDSMIGDTCTALVLLTLPKEVQRNSLGTALVNKAWNSGWKHTADAQSSGDSNCHEHLLDCYERSLLLGFEKSCQHFVWFFGFTRARGSLGNVTLADTRFTFDGTAPKYSPFLTKFKAPAELTGIIDHLNTVEAEASSLINRVLDHIALQPGGLSLPTVVPDSTTGPPRDFEVRAKIKEESEGHWPKQLHLRHDGSPPGKLGELPRRWRIPV